MRQSPPNRNEKRLNIILIQTKKNSFWADLKRDLKETTTRMLRKKKQQRF
jgi:hypothetical protein